MMSHPEHEDPAMAGHDDETAERAANRMLWESGLSALCDSCDDAKACLADLLEADAGFELRPEMEAAIRNLDMVKSRVAERLGYLESVSGEPEDAPSSHSPSAGSAEDDRRLAGHPSERDALRESAMATLASRPIDLVEMHRLWAAEVSDEV